MRREHSHTLTESNVLTPETGRDPAEVCSVARSTIDLGVGDAQAMLDQAEGTVIAFSLHRLRIIRTNLAAQLLTGFSPELLLGCHLVDLVQADERDQLLASLSALRDGKTSEARLRFHLPVRNGGSAEVHGRVRLVHLPSQPLPCFVALLHRVPPATALEQQVLDERGRAQQILENLHDGVIECDLVNRRHVYANARFCELVGMSVDQVLSAPWPGPWWGPETRAAITAFSDPAWHDQRADDADDCLDAEQTLSRPDGTTLPVRVNICAIERSASTLAVALVHDLTRARARDDELATARRELALVTDRERIARNLHDTAIQRLYATGLHLQSALNRKDIDERVWKAIDEIDEIIREIRTSIFTLQVPRTLLEGLERAVRSTVAEAARVLGFQPQLSITGDLDMVPSDVAYEVLAVTRELLTNIAKHASARHTWVAVAHDVHGVTLTVTDDGVGYQPVAGRAGRGVGNLLARAQAQGGTCVMSPYEPSGTTVSWWVPLDASCTPAQFEVAP